VYVLVKRKYILILNSRWLNLSSIEWLQTHRQWFTPYINKFDKVKSKTKNDKEEAFEFEYQ